MRSVEGAPDFGRLEDRLCERIAEAKREGAAGALTPVLVVVPSALLRSHLQRLLAARFGALLNVTILHHAALAARAAEAMELSPGEEGGPRTREEGPAGLPRELPRPVREAILEGCLDAPAGAGSGSGSRPGPAARTARHSTSKRLAAYLELCPGALAGLAETMNELRNAGVAPAEAMKAAGVHGRGRESLALYSEYCAALGGLAGRGLADPAERLRVAAPHVAAWISRSGFGAVIHYGAYELIGSKLDMMRAVEEVGARVTWILPFHPESPAYAFARRFVTGSLSRRVGEAAEAGLRPGEGIALPGREVSGGAEADGLSEGGVVLLAGGGSDRLLGGRLHLLYDEDAEIPPALPAGTVRFFHAQGAAEELRETALRILEARREDPSSRLTTVAIISRSLDPYTPHLARVLHEEFRLPFTTKADLPALEDRHIRAALDLVAVIGGAGPERSRGVSPSGSAPVPSPATEGFERGPLLDLARSGLLRSDSAERSSATQDGEAWDVDAWDLMSRRFRIVRGKDAWVQDLPAEAARFPPEPPADAPEREKARAALQRGRMASAAGSLRRLVEDLDASAAPLRAARGWAAWASALEGLLARWISGFDERTREGSEGSRSAPGVGTVLDALAELKIMGDCELPFTPAKARARFELSLGEARIPLGSVGGDAALSDNGGVRVLEAIESRGLAFDDVYLIGFNADLFPRRPREDPFLEDDDRGILGEALGAPIPVKSAGREEEHLILAHVLGAARRRLTVSWQRADEAGRAKVPSLALREIARVALGTADAALPLAPESARRAASHPADRTREILEERGSMPRDLARLGSILSLASPRSVRQAASAIPAPSPKREELTANFLPGLKLLEAVESFGTGDLSHDAVVGRAAAVRTAWSPSALERLGNCPQQFFFGDVLGVEPLDDVMQEHEMDLGELGSLAHAVLRDVYAALIGKGLISRPGADPEEAARAAVRLLDEIWPARAKRLAGRLHRHHALLWRSLAELWRNALTTFLLHDIVDLERSGARVLGVEHAVSVEVPIPGLPAPLALRGRFDRIVRDGSGRPVVADYKTAGDLEKRVDITRMLKGHSLQMPLYILMEEAEALAQERDPGGVDAEVIGVGPAYSEGSVEGANPEGYPSRERVDREKFAKFRGGLMETIRILVETASGGIFPLNAETGWCRSCAFVRACRKDHHPTLARLESSPETASYLSLGGKSIRRPFAESAAREEGGEP